MSFSALIALFAGLPAKAAAASVVAVATVGGLAATNNLPESLQTGLERASEQAGFTVPVENAEPAARGGQDEEALADVDSDDETPEIEAHNSGQGEERSAEARAQGAERKEEALDHAEEASAGAGDNNDHGFERARAGGENGHGPSGTAGGASQGDQRRQDAAENKNARATGDAGGQEATTDSDDSDDDTDSDTDDTTTSDQRDRGDDARANAPAGRPSSD